LSSTIRQRSILPSWSPNTALDRIPASWKCMRRSPAWGDDALGARLGSDEIGVVMTALKQTATLQT
jgi:hypothetical protein